ncbi:hypothetical protein LTR37_018082 [Vermiconidia calcicola]|uniref:Uncharacterized protein n=1 Tax=Vermiconidia calcicola TaxID=1690605 RepID=A0ACC3MIB8_9PEZI|nr:hypothetical protein LTR37_018082 [Vermiconidia calcicola]
MPSQVSYHPDAEVIKIEHPTRGDDTRAWGPPYASYTESSGKTGPGESAYFLSVNRNKKSLGLSFQHSSGVDILHRLAKDCDVLVENYLPGALKKYGMDYETLSKVNPSLIYASITGYGQNGPNSNRAGYDVMVEAEMGLMHITGHRDGPPAKVGVAITDLTTGLYTSNSVMAALLGRAKTGRGQHLDVALSDCQTASLANIASSCLISGQPDTGRWGTAHPSIVPYKGFKTKEGDVMLGGGNDRLYGVLCDCLGKSEWKSDSRFATNAQRVQNREELERLIEEITVTKTTKEWLEVLDGSGMPYSAINDVKATLEHDHTKARNMVTQIEHPSCGPMKLVSPPVKFSESKPSFKDKTLVDNRSFVGGEWIGSSSQDTFPVYDPEDNEKICDIADLGQEDARKALEAAQKAFDSYKTWTNRERRWLIRRWADLIKENKEDLAAICTLELGKPYTEALGTVRYGTDFLDWFEGAIERQYGETIPAARANTRIFTIRQPQGVVAAITPWNSPVAMVTRKVGAAIAAGNTVVLKPAPETPLCAIAVAKLFERAGGPPGVLNIVTSSTEKSAQIGEEFTQNDIVKHLSFTGSTGVGKYLHGEASRRLIKTSMELGGNAPFIVFGDAKLDSAAEGLISSKFRSSGQTCICANRIFVHSSVIDKFAEVLEEKMNATFTFGSVWDSKVNFGPLYSGKAFEKIKAQIEDAMSRGGKIVSSSKSPSDHGPNFFPPTIVKGATAEMRFMKEETFGPLAFLVPFETDEEVVAMANKTNAGLASYFYTDDISRLWKVAEALQSGMVGVRVGLISACEQPFGGTKDSGVGREGGKDALDEYTEIKSITVGI